MLTKKEREQAEDYRKDHRGREYDLDRFIIKVYDFLFRHDIDLTDPNNEKELKFSFYRIQYLFSLVYCGKSLKLVLKNTNFNDPRRAALREITRKLFDIGKVVTENNIFICNV